MKLKNTERIYHSWFSRTDHQFWGNYGGQLPDVQFGGPYTYEYTWWIQGDYPKGGFGLFCPRSVFDDSDDTEQYLTGSLILSSIRR